MNTAVVLLTDSNYFAKAKRTILDIRTRGQWTNDVVLITVGFDASPNFLDYYNIIQHRVEHIDTSYILEQYTKRPIRPTCDNREFAKLTQWDKFYVFDQFFSKWSKIIYVDAGLRIFDSVKYLDELDCTGSILAPDDAPPYDMSKRFRCIIELDQHGDIVHKLLNEYPLSILNERYFLNCIWVYDTSILKTIHVSELIDCMNKYPICRCNEMTIMNLIFTFKYKLWKPFPEFCLSNPHKRLFTWTEHDRHYGHHNSWRDFCFIKYPTTINFDCE